MRLKAVQAMFAKKKQEKVESRNNEARRVGCLYRWFCCVKVNDDGLVEESSCEDVADEPDERYENFNRRRTVARDGPQRETFANVRRSTDSAATFDDHVDRKVRELSIAKDTENRLRRFNDHEFVENIKKRRLEDNGFVENFYMELSMASLNSFYQRAQRDLLAFLAYFRINAKTERIIFSSDPRFHNHYMAEEFRLRCFFNGLHSKDVLDYWNELARRKMDIETVIEWFFERSKVHIVEDLLAQRDHEIEKTFVYSREKKKLE